MILDRCHQARVANALEPEWEARFEPKSYGFRPGRGCHDAIEAIFQVAKGKSPRRLWVLDADLAGAFDRIGHDHILTMIGSFPARGMIREWLKAGVVENGRLSRTEEGTPQGGVASPLLLNIALHGMETAAGARYGADGYARNGSPMLIRYADDFVVHCHTRQEAIEVKARLAAWLAPRGLAFNEDKTQGRVAQRGLSTSSGSTSAATDGKLLIKPSKAAVRRIRERLRDELRSLRGSNAQAVISRLNPIIRGWAAYYRTQVSAETFGKLDHYLWRLTCKWATASHPNKPTHWVIARYFGKFNKARQDRWVFGDRTQRRLHAPLRLDQHRPTPDRQAPGITRRPRACRLLGLATAQSAPADQPHRPTAPPSPGRSLRDLQEHAARRSRTGHKPHTNGRHWLATTRKTIDVVWDQARRTRLTPRLIHLHCNHTRQPPGLA